MSTSYPTDPKTCEHCGEEYERREGESWAKFYRRRFCGTKCAIGWRRERRAIRAAASVGRQRIRFDPNDAFYPPPSV